MTSGRSLLSFSPDESDEDTIVVSKKKLDKFLKDLEAKDAEITRLRKEAEELRRRLRVHENPNVPPSVRNHSPGYDRMRPLVPPESRKRPGPKAGHPGSTRPPLIPDRRVTLAAERCGRCRGHRLERVRTDLQTEVELPPPRMAVVTEYTVPIYRCLDCGEEVRGTLPNGREPSGYGPQLQSEAVLGKIEERLPYRKLQDRLAREGAPMSSATIQGLVWAASDALGEEYAEILERIRAAPSVHADETSYRVGGHRWWLWTFTTTTDTLLVLRPSRGEEVVREVLGEGFPGKVIVCDGHGAYPHPEKGWLLQRCWAHLLRMARDAEETEPRGELLSDELAGLYRWMTEELARDGRRAHRRQLHRIGSRELGRLLRRYESSRWGARRKVGVYLHNGWGSWLTFLKRPGVEPTNNRGERALREAVVIRKIVGTLRNPRGAEVFARLLSVLGTWKLRQEDPLAKLHAALN
jgi:transposase